jgi:hypothetical protein
MATANQVTKAADDLVQSLQNLLDDGRYAPYRETLDGSVVDLATARDNFAGSHAGGSSKPNYAGVVTKLGAAKGKADKASPTDSSMRLLARSVNGAINALRAA